MDLRTAEYHWVLNLLPASELPWVASSALSNGFESKTLIELASSLPGDAVNLGELFEKALSELALGKMSKQEALRCYTREISEAIVSGEISPRDGASRIWKAKVHSGVKDFHELDEFIYSASEMQDRPQDKAFFENAIKESAKQWSERETSSPRRS